MVNNLNQQCYKIGIQANCERHIWSRWWTLTTSRIGTWTPNLVVEILICVVQICIVFFCFYQGSMSILLYKRRRIVAPSLKLHIYYSLIFSNLVKMKIFIFLDLHNNINFHMQVAEHRIWLVRWIELPPTSRVVWRFQFHWNAPPPPLTRAGNTWSRVTSMLVIQWSSATYSSLMAKVLERRWEPLFEGKLCMFENATQIQNKLLNKQIVVLTCA